ncbi:hypothetical protein BH23GEM7_BH23GEM7_38890 [soil metagenome]
MSKRIHAVVGTLLLLGAAACADLTVPNENEPNTGRVLASPADVEQLIINSYLSYHNATIGFTSGYDPGINAQMSAASFEHTPMAANFGMIERSALPRLPIGNTTADAFRGQYEATWYGSYRAIKAANDGLTAISGGLVINNAADTRRAEAFAKFVRGLAHGTLALVYDQAFIVDENTPDPTVRPLTAGDLAPYGEVMTAALRYLDEAIAVSQANTFTIPTTWINGVQLTNQDLVRLANSYKARYRAEVARTREERQAVNWQQVIADVDAGRQTDLMIEMDDVNWQHVIHVYHSFYGAWNQVNPMILGMADQSGRYQTWIGTPLGERTAFLMVTPDMRFPQGSTAAAQQANPGLYIRHKGNAGHVRPDRGTWRWSLYRDSRFQEFYDNGWAGPLPVLTRAEMQLLKAEGLLRTGDAAGAATIINQTRVGNGGLAPVTQGSNPDCVPKLPSGACGDLLEALKWEKRLETWATRMGSWFFDSRGWGDLVQGTAIHYPVPAKELLVLRAPLYTFGGVGQPGAAGPSTYNFGL